MGDSDKALLEAGRATLAGFDLPLAEDCFRQACVASGGAIEAAQLLLTVLVDHLGSDAQAVEFAVTLPPGTRRDPTVRLLLAIAKARLESWADAEGLLLGLDDARVTEALLLCGHAALASGQDADARRLWDRARRGRCQRCDRDPSLDRGGCPSIGS